MTIDTDRGWQLRVHLGPRRVLDDAYRTFFGLIAAHIGTALSNATAYEAEQAELLARIETQIRRRRAEADRERLVSDLTESHRLIRQMADASPDTIYVYDLADGHTSYLSARAEQVIGYTADEIIERGDRFAMELWHPDDKARLPEYRRRLATLADGEVFESEYRVRQRDHSYRWLRSRVAPLSRTADGQLQRIVGVTQDITDRKRADQALHDSEERFRRYFELGLIGMAITTPAKGLVEVNDGKSGCGPAPLKFRLEGGNVVLAENDVLEGWRFFR
jgi:PAS domain S-box-containing protein